MVTFVPEKAPLGVARHLLLCDPMALILP